MPIHARNLAGVMLVTAVAMAVTPAAAAGAPTTEREAALDEAVRSSGLDAEAAKAALTDPALRNAVLIPHRTEQVVEVPAMPRQPGLNSRSALRARSVRHGVVYRTLWRQRAASFFVTKYWEYDGRRITYAPRPRVTANVTSIGTALGWDYAGLIGRGDHYYRWARLLRSGHKSWRQGKFVHCPGSIGCFWKKYPLVIIWAHADGSYSRRVRG